MTDASRTLVNRYYDALNHRRWDDYDHLFSADAALEASGAITGTGPAAMRAFDQVWTTAAPDFTITPLTQVAAGSQVISENLAEGTHHGVLALPAGPVPATGSQFGGKYAGVFEIADGKITAQRVYFDRMAVAEQLGLLPAPASTTA